MHKVVDFNALPANSGLLEVFFRESQDNVAVLTDMMGIECLKRDGMVNYGKSFGVLSQYSRRVIVLQPSQALWRMRPTKRDFKDIIVDKELTLTFPAFCQTILSDATPRVQSIIEADQLKAQTLMGKIQTLVDVDLRRSMTEYEARFPATQLAKWKSSPSLQQDELMVIRNMVAGVTQGSFCKMFPKEPLPDAEDALYWFPFRYTVALQALTMKWIKDGGYRTAKAATLRNDSVDIFYVAYGTIFDGVLSEDRKLQALSQFTDEILKRAYGLPSR